ncbi:MAG: TorF family putative porin, partial [Pseudomonadota bacterium]
MKKITAAATAVAITGLLSTGAVAGDWTANASFSNNYLWRGLTQTQNEPVVSGGIDYAHESGFYVGTWVANV